MIYTADSLPSLTLRIFEAGVEVTTVTFTKPNITLGSSPRCDIQLQASVIDPQHLLIRFQGGTYHVRESSQAGLLLLNGQRCSQAELREGDQLGLGPYLFLLGAGEGEATTAEARPLGFETGATPENATTTAQALPRPPSDKTEIARLVTIVLDPGHGGEDPGAIGRGGSQEKNVTLSVARRLKAKIDATPNMRSVLTRDGYSFIPLQSRVHKARRVQADLFVSVHADAFIKSTARGSSVFVLSENGASSSAARWLANKENSADLVGGVNIGVKDPYLARTLLDLSQTATINDSLKLGKDVLGELGRINTLHKAHVEQAGFAVLKAPDIPSILIETAFISNPEEEARLNDEAYQDRMAEAILRGIRGYFARNPPLAKSKLARLD